MKEKTVIHCLGGGQEVGRSSFLLDCGEKILLDYGVKLTPKETEFPLPIETNLDAVVISHAHLDHSGHLPSLFTFTHCLTFLTPSTLEIAKLLWLDSLKIAGFEGMDSGYSKREIERVERFAFPLGFRKKIQVSKHSTLEFFDAGHISGSALAKLHLPNGKNLLYTGDFNAEETRLYKKADLKVGKVDFLIIESTYADRNHPKRENAEKQFVEAVLDTLEQGGRALVSAFAVGRSQEVIDVLQEYKIKVPVYFDGMGQKAAAVMMRYPELLKKPKFLKKALQNVRWVKGSSFRDKALKEPSVIVTTSGMLSGGPVCFYMKKMLKDKNSMLLLTGFQVEGTPGRMLLDKGEIELDGMLVKPEFKVRKFDFSAHSGRDSLFETVEKLSPEKVLCVHGDKEIAKGFARELKEKGFDAVAPKNGDAVEL